MSRRFGLGRGGGTVVSDAPGYLVVGALTKVLRTPVWSVMAWKKRVPG